MSRQCWVREGEQEEGGGEAWVSGNRGIELLGMGDHLTRNRYNMKIGQIPGIYLLRQGITF